jgi:hypothetical protein
MLVDNENKFEWLVVGGWVSGGWVGGGWWWLVVVGGEYVNMDIDSQGVCKYGY